jgi:Cu2+-exporting ATPase
MLALAHHRRAAVRTAFAFALIYNATAITFALLGHMNPLVAAIIMPLSSAISLGIVGLGLRTPRGGSVSQAAHPNPGDGRAHKPARHQEPIPS